MKTEIYPVYDFNAEHTEAEKWWEVRREDATGRGSITRFATEAEARAGHDVTDSDRRKDEK